MFVQAEWIGLVGTAASSSTKGKRRASWRHWISFVKGTDAQVELLKPREIDICLWLVYLYKRKLAFSTIKVYLYSLNSEIKFRGGKAIVKPHETWFIHTTLKAIEKKVGSKDLVFRRPLTVPILEKIVGELDFSQGDNLLYATMLAVGVYGLFRVNELCYVKKEGSPKFISNKDVEIFPDHATISIFNTKTDPKVKKVIGNISEGKVNPFAYIKALRSSKKNSREASEPFFANSRGIPITRDILVAFMQGKLKFLYPKIPSKEWNGISLRKGGATSAMKAGVTGEVIKKLGNWKSTEYLRYVTVDDEDIIKAQKRAAIHRPTK